MDSAYPRPDWCFFDAISNNGIKATPFAAATIAQQAMKKRAVNRYA